MGGWLCLEVMRTAPEKIAQLCLLNTTARGDTEEKKKRRKHMMACVQKGEFGQVAREIVDVFVYRSEVKQAVEDVFLSVGEKAFLRQEEAMLQRRECASILPTITCPTWVIHAKQDRNFSLEEHREMPDRILQVHLEIVEGSGHMSPMETPLAIAEFFCQWLKKLLEVPG